MAPHRELGPPPQAANLGGLPEGALPVEVPLPDGAIPVEGSLPEGAIPVQGSAAHNLVSPAGELVGMPAEHVQAALSQGYRQATREDEAKFARHEQYGTFGQQILTGAEAAGEALTFGVSPAIETGLGLTTKEAIK